MFTGIVEEVGAITEAAEGLLWIRAPFVLQDAKLGDSIAINGVDLTVAEIRGDTFFANLMPETYRRSNLGALRPGERPGRRLAWGSDRVVASHARVHLGRTTPAPCRSGTPELAPPVPWRTRDPGPFSRRTGARQRP